MLQLKQRQTVEEGTENWDDDDFDIGGDSDFIFPSRATSVATTATGGFNLSTRRDHRDSITSRLSMRSDCEDDDESQVQVPGDDERSKNDAIAAAIRAGIPIPQNIPASALLGGTIKRLGGRKVKKVVQQDDWDDDLELPALGKGILTLRCHDPSEYPDALRHVSGPNPSSPMKRIDIPPTPEGEKDEFDMYATIKPTRSVQASILDRFRDNDDDDDMFGRGGETLKVTKRRMPKPMTLIQPPSPVKGEEKPDDDFASDLQLPHNKPLRLSIGRDIPAGKDVPKTPTISQDDFDEWGEGSLGTRFGGTRRSIGRSNSRSARSSSATMSPSISSSVTFESEDEGLDGIEIPTGPLDFGGLLKRRREMQTPEEPPSPPKPAQPAPKRPAAPPRLSSRDDFLSGLEIGDDDVFSKKLTLNRNVKVKTVRQTSPQRPKTVATLKFTDKPTAAAPVTSRLPRPLGHERHTSSLDPVSETAAPTTTRGIKRSQKLGGGFHTPNTSISIISTPQGTPTSSVNNSQMPPPSTPRRRALDAKPSFASLRNEPTTTSAQLLKVKRSMPIIRNTNSPAKPINPRYERPTSRNEATPVSTRPIPTGRKTPNESQSDRSGAESGMGGTLRRKPPPFLAGGSSAAQSHHITVKTSRHFRQNDSMSSNVSGEGYRSTSRTMSRAGLRSPSPAGQKSYATTGSMRLRGPEALAREAASKRQITKPTKKQHFGDGRELDGFDDLPTSSCIEQKYIKQPVARGPPKTLRNKVYNSGSSTLPTPVASSPARNENREPTLPRFARDTNASRMAREQVISQRHPSSGNPLGTLTNQWKAQVTARTGLQPLNTNTLRPKKPRQPVQKRPHLIKPMNDVAKTPKCKFPPSVTCILFY